MTELEELKKLLAEAGSTASGPWKHVPWHVEEGPPAVRHPSGYLIANTDVDANAALIVAAVNALPGLIARVEEMERALADMADCQPLPKIYKYTGTAEVDVENMFDVGHRHVSGKKPYDYLKSWLSMLRPFAYATQDDSWGELEKLISIVMNNYVQILVKAETARAALKKEP